MQLRNQQRDAGTNDSDADYVNTPKQRLSQNEVNRSMSIRSSGEPSHRANGSEPGDVTLRHSQSARESRESRPGSTGEERNSTYGLVGGHSKRDSASIICSNNSNNTRTLLMQSPLVDSTAIQVSCSSAHVAEPFLTPGEKLRRLDASIRNDLLEKQKIICDIFRLPVEHYDQIVDIAMMPEAPKDSADIALAAYDQIQTLTKMLNEYMHVTPEQEVSAVSTVVCNHCHEKDKLRKKPVVATLSSSSDTPPPLPPPNRQQAQPQAQPQIPPARPMPKLQPLDLDEVAIHEDDDGYCEIDELRLPAIPSKSQDSMPPTPLAPFKVEPKSPKEAAEEPAKLQRSEALEQSLEEKEKVAEEAQSKPEAESEQPKDEKETLGTETSDVAEDSSTKVDNKAALDESQKENNEEAPVDKEDKPEDDKPDVSEAVVNIYSTYYSFIFANLFVFLQIAEASGTLVDSSTQTVPETSAETDKLFGGSGSTCGPNRIQHASALEPSVPCHALSSILTVLNEQISLLLVRLFNFF